MFGMAKKKENEFKYLQMPLPEGGSKSRSVKVDWSGLNCRKTTDTGYLSYEKNISVKEAPYLSPAEKIIKKLDFGNLATSWNSPEDIYSTYKPGELTIDGVALYGIDFGDNPHVVRIERASGSIYTLTAELSTGEKKTIDSIPVALRNVKKLYAANSSNWDSFLNYGEKAGEINVYDIADELTDRQISELTNTKTYFDDYGYIVKNISAYKNLLFICYYSWKESNSTDNNSMGYFTANCMIYDTDSMEAIKPSSLPQPSTVNFMLGTKDESRIFSDLPDVKACIFNALRSSVTLADYSSTSDIVKTVLFYPPSYSLSLDRIENITYRSGTRYVNDWRIRKDVLYPYSFVDDFTDKNITYNVIENPACKIPRKSDLQGYWQGGTKFYKFDEYDDGYVLSDNDSDNASWILGYWKFSTSANKWLPSGYDAETKKKVNKLPQTAKITGAPHLKDVCVYQSRLFGINDIGVYASGYGNYANWTLDDAEAYNSDNAWMSLIVSDETFAGKPTAIKVYQDAVIVFCENHIYEIRNKKNPFRIVDIFDEGCISSEACCVVNGYLLFASKNGVRMYTGSKPKDIGYNLGINTIYYASCGTDGTNWYLYCESDKGNALFIYDTQTGLWAEQEIDSRLISFAATSAGVFALDSNNKVYLINSKTFDGQEWACETDFISGGTVDIKHIKKIQMLADVGTGSSISVHILRDDEKFDELSQQELKDRCVYSYANSADKSKTVVIRAVPKKTADYRYKIRISGVGYSKVYQMDISIQTGGELFSGQI